MRYTFAFWLLSLAVVGCGPSDRDDACHGADCDSGPCRQGTTRECYTGKDETIGVGPCVVGEQKCTPAGVWGNCIGEVTPEPEYCGDNLDNNCNGATDEIEDRDNDGFTTCAGPGGGDCCDSTECSDPQWVNPSAFDSPGNNVDDDCNGAIDDSVALCDQALMSSSSVGLDYARAMDICQDATPNDKKWGVVSAALTFPDGTGVPDPNSHSIRHHFGTMTMPRGGVSMALFSSGVAAGKGDMNPNYTPFDSYIGSAESGFPTDFLAANNGSLPNAPGCPDPVLTTANDPVMLTLEIRVPSNAHSFSLKTNFYSAEFPEWTCSEYNDFFVILLDSMYTGNPANPMDKNLAFYTQPGTTNNYPVGVNLAFGNTGLFTQCVNGTTGCSSFGGMQGTINTCSGTTDLTGTGFDEPDGGSCDANSLSGGATGWLTTSGNVVPGETIKLRIAIWDTSDHALDSLSIVDGFQWSVDSTQPGTVILKEDQPWNPKAVASTKALTQP